MGRTPFFNFNLHQEVNEWLGLSLIILMCFWVVLFYILHRTADFAENYVAVVSPSAHAAGK